MLTLHPQSGDHCMFVLSLLLLLTQFRTPVHGAEPPTFRVGLFTPFSLIYLILHKKAQRLVFLVILDHVKLTALAILTSCFAPDNHESVLYFLGLLVQLFHIMKLYNMWAL